MSTNKLIVKKSRAYVEALKAPMNTLQRQKLLSYYSSLPFRRGKPTLNRAVNLRLNNYRLQATKVAQPTMWTTTLKLSMLRRMATIRREFGILLGSRIIQFLLLSPMLYLSYKVGRRMYIEIQSYKYPQYYIKPASPIMDKVKGYVTGVVGEVLRDKEVVQKGLDFLSKLFTDPSTHEAAVILLKNVLQDPRFVEEGKVFGVDLISSVVRSPQCEEDFKQLVMRTL